MAGGMQQVLGNQGNMSSPSSPAVSIKSPPGTPRTPKTPPGPKSPQRGHPLHMGESIMSSLIILSLHLVIRFQVSF